MVEHIEALSGTGGVPIHQVKHSTTTSSLAHIGELFSVMQSLGELFSDCSPDLNPHRSGREDSHLITNDPSGHPPHYELIPMHTTASEDQTSSLKHFNST